MSTATILNHEKTQLEIAHLKTILPKMKEELLSIIHMNQILRITFISITLLFMEMKLQAILSKL